MDSPGGSGADPATFEPDCGEYLKRWGFTLQNPLKRAYEQRLAQVKRWLDEACLAIAARAKREKAEIQWGDETGLRSDSQHGRSYAPKGKTPVIRRSAKRVSMNMLSTVSNQGKVRFMVYSGGMNAKRLMQFLKPLFGTFEHRIFLILGNLRHASCQARQSLTGKGTQQGADRGLFSAGLLTGTESGRISELRSEGGCAFKAAGQRHQPIGKEGTLTHEDFAEITCSGTKILQAYQDRLCRIICYMFNCRVNSKEKPRIRTPEEITIIEMPNFESHNHHRNETQSYIERD